MIESLSQRVDQIQQSVELLQRDVVELVPIVRESSGTLPLVRGLADSLKQCIESIRRVAQRPTSDWIPIGSFAPEPYEVTQTITVVVSPVGDEFEAGIVDINAYTTGDTSEEAVRNLKSYLLDLFDRYSEIADEQLGPEPLRQKAYLLGHVRRR